jgi:hypothetical protein
LFISVVMCRAATAKAALATRRVGLDGRADGASRLARNMPGSIRLVALMATMPQRSFDPTDHTRAMWYYRARKSASSANEASGVFRSRGPNRADSGYAHGLRALQSPETWAGARTVSQPRRQDRMPMVLTIWGLRDAIARQLWTCPRLRAVQTRVKSTVGARMSPRSGQDTPCGRHNCPL